jgi:hypothetical protein
MSREVVRTSICLSLNNASGRLAFGGARDQHFADTLASDLKDRLCVEIARKLQSVLRNLNALRSKISGG